MLPRLSILALNPSLLPWPSNAVSVALASTCLLGSCGQGVELESVSVEPEAVAEISDRAVVVATPPVVLDRSRADSWGEQDSFGGVEIVRVMDRFSDGAVRRVAIGRTIVLERITEWEPGKVLAYELEGLPRIIASVSNRWVLVADAASTTVSLTTIVEPGPRPPMKAAAAVAARRIGATNKSLLDGLVIEAEKIGATR